MSIYTKQIEQALGQAPPIQYEHDTPRLAMPEQKDYRPLGLHDLSPMACGYTEEVLPSTIVVKEPAELKNVYKELARITSTMHAFGHEEQQLLDKQIQTQVEHAYIAGWLGAAESRYLLSIYGYSPDTHAVAWSFGHQALRLTTTRIGCALLLVYPTTPSVSSLLRIHALGYEGVDDVGQRAEKYSLPLPLSYKAAGGHI